MSSTFKVGDVCRIVQDRPLGADLDTTDIVRVVSVHEDQSECDGYIYTVHSTALEKTAGSVWVVRARHMKLLQEEGPGEEDGHRPEGYKGRISSSDVEDARVVTDANPKQAYGDKKLPFHLVPPAATAFISLGLRDGAVKYGPWNWRETNVEAMTYIGAIKRHLGAWVDGEELATDSGVPHLAHAIAGLSILIDAMTSDRMIDNRPPKGAVPEVLEGWKLEEPPKE